MAKILNILMVKHSPLYKYIYGNTRNIVSSKLEIIGIDVVIIIILLPISILVAIELSPASLQMLVPNSARIAIPVTFNSTTTNLLLIAILFE